VRSAFGTELTAFSRVVVPRACASHLIPGAMSSRATQGQLPVSSVVDDPLDQLDGDQKRMSAGGVDGLDRHPEPRVDTTTPVFAVSHLQAAASQSLLDRFRDRRLRGPDIFGRANELNLDTQRGQLSQGALTGYEDRDCADDPGDLSPEPTHRARRKSVNQQKKVRPIGRLA
jgi:hypothetical protein